MRAVILIFVFTLLASTTSAQSTVRVWWSSELYPADARWFTDPPPESDVRHRLSRQKDLVFGTSDTAAVVIRVDPQVTYQSVLGIGTSLEATTLYAIRKGRTPAQMREVLKALLDPEIGMGFNLIRITIGTSDFSDGRSVSDHPKGFYSYQDDENGPFSIQNDIDLGIVETLKLAQEVAAQRNPPHPLTFFASIWSPPGWMKTSGALIAGTLKVGYEKRLAQYYRDFVEAYEAQGIPIYAMTLQNEPNYVPTAYPGMLLSAEQERDIVIAAYENFHDTSGGNREINTRLWIHDHNFDGWEKADEVLSSLALLGKKHYVDAIAFHNYESSPASNMTRLHERHPETDIVFTEHSEFGVSGIYNIQQYFWNWSRSYVYWVTMTTQQLDEHNQGPYNALGALSPPLLINDDAHPPRWYRTPAYYLISQFSRFVQPGALRIAADRGSPESVTAVSFLNPDATVATVVVNQTDRDQPFTLVYEGRTVTTVLPYKSVGTYVWDAVP